MSRHIYRLCYTQSQANRTSLKISKLILGWFRQFFVKSNPILICIKPQTPQANETIFKSTLSECAPAKTNNSATKSQLPKVQSNEHPELHLNHSNNPLTSSPQVLANPLQVLGQIPEQTQGLGLAPAQDKNTQVAAPTIGLQALIEPSKKSNLLFLKVYNGPIFQDKKVLACTNNLDQPTPAKQADASSSVVRQFPPQAKHKNGVFMSGKMSDIFAQLDALAA